MCSNDNKEDLSPSDHDFAKQADEIEQAFNAWDDELHPSEVKGVIWKSFWEEKEKEVIKDLRDEAERRRKVRNKVGGGASKPKRDSCSKAARKHSSDEKKDGA